MCSHGGRSVLSNFDYADDQVTSASIFTTFSTNTFPIWFQKSFCCLFNTATDPPSSPVGLKGDEMPDASEFRKVMIEILPGSVIHLVVIVLPQTRFNQFSWFREFHCHL